MLHPGRALPARVLRFTRRAAVLCLLSTMAAGLGTGLTAAPARAGKVAPEDILKGQLIISDRKLPMNWSSAGAYASQLKGLNKTSLFYDKKTGKVQVYYAAFFAQPVNDIQVNFVIYDITNGPGNKFKKGSWE